MCRSSTPLAVLYLEAASRAVATIATFTYWRSDDFSDEAFHRQTDTSMLACECRQGTAYAANDNLAVALDMRCRPEVVIQHLARCGSMQYNRVRSLGLSAEQQRDL